MRKLTASVFSVVLAFAVIIQTIVFFVAGPPFGSSEDITYFIVFLLLWFALGFFVSLSKKLSIGRRVAFIFLFMLLGIIVRGLFELFVIPLAIAMAIWSFYDD